VFAVSILYTRSHELSYISISNPDILLNSILNAILGSFFYIVMVIAIYLFIGLIWKVVKKRQIGEVSAFGILILLFAFSQLYPAWDPAHIWWVFPVIAISFAINSRQSFIDYVFSRFRPLIVAMVIFGLFASVSYLFQERQYFSVPLLSGMKSEPIALKNIESNLVALNALKTDSVSIKFDCPDALYSVSNSIVQRFSQDFINWGPALDTAEMNYDYVFVCNTDRDYFQMKYSVEYRIIETLPSVDFSDKFNLIGQRFEK